MYLKIKNNLFFSTNINGDKNDAVSFELNKNPLPSAIFLDPMYDKINEAALPSKTMRILREELMPTQNDDFEKLFLTSLRVARNRVVLKRSLKAEVKYKEFFFIFHVLVSQQGTMSI